MRELKTLSEVREAEMQAGRELIDIRDNKLWAATAAKSFDDFLENYSGCVLGQLRLAVEDCGRYSRLLIDRVGNVDAFNSFDGTGLSRAEEVAIRCRMRELIEALDEQIDALKIYA